MNVRVPGFLPTINGLHFTNSWPTGTGPDYTFNVLGQTIKLGDASNGLCGGMVYTVKDLFDTRLLPPADAALPVDGSPLFNYIVARLTQSFNEDDVNQYLSYIQMFDHDTFVEGHGLAWHEIMEEWPKIKSDLDAGGLSPMESSAPNLKRESIRRFTLCHRPLLCPIRPILLIYSSSVSQNGA